jgi:predicted nicotinamide N-methyase
VRGALGTLKTYSSPLDIAIRLGGRGRSVSAATRGVSLAGKGGTFDTMSGGHVLDGWQLRAQDSLFEPRAFIREHLRVQTLALVPEFELYLADALVPLWEATEWRAAAPQAPPFWAYAWPGSQALARYLVDTPSLVQHNNVLDFGAGSGLASIAAARCGAAHVLAVDVDPLASVAQHMNAELNGVHFESRRADACDLDVDVDVVLAGDVCYEREPAERALAWLRALARRGTLVLLADPGRHYAPQDGLELLATYDVPTLLDLESVAHKRTRLWMVLAL